MCGNCHFWTASDHYRCPTGFGDCANEHFIRTYRGEAETLADVVVEPDEGWGIFTGPEFGCIHAVAKERQ